MSASLSSQFLSGKFDLAHWHTFEMSKHFLCRRYVICESHTFWKAIFKLLSCLWDTFQTSKYSVQGSGISFWQSTIDRSTWANISSQWISQVLAPAIWQPTMVAADIKASIYQLELINTRRHLKPRWILKVFTDLRIDNYFYHICIRITEIFWNIFFT